MLVAHSAALYNVIYTEIEGYILRATMSIMSTMVAPLAVLLSSLGSIQS
jgi:hypothetical protein